MEDPNELWTVVASMSGERSAGGRVSKGVLRRLLLLGQNLARASNVPPARIRTATMTAKEVMVRLTAMTGAVAAMPEAMENSYPPVQNGRERVPLPPRKGNPRRVRNEKLRRIRTRRRR